MFIYDWYDYRLLGRKFFIITGYRFLYDCYCHPWIGFVKGGCFFYFFILFFFATYLRLFRVNNYALSSYPIFLRTGPILSLVEIPMSASSIWLISPLPSTQTLHQPLTAWSISVLESYIHAMRAHFLVMCTSKVRKRN